MAILVSCDYSGHLRLQPLPKTDTDREAMSQTFKSFGYDVHELYNKDATEEGIISLLRQVEAFLRDKKNIGEETQNKAIVFAFSGRGNSDEDNTDFVFSQKGGRIRVIEDIVAPFLGHDGSVMKIPKLFFIDANRGGDWLVAALDRGKEEEEVNFRIDYALFPEQNDPSEQSWMQLVATTLKEDMSIDDVMAEVKKKTFKPTKTLPILPETRDRLVTGPLRLK